MLKLQVKKAFYDWQVNVLRQAGEAFEVTQERYEEMKKNFSSQELDVTDFVEVVEVVEDKTTIENKEVLNGSDELKGADGGV